MNVIHCAASRRTRSMPAKKLIYANADWNKDPILQVLREFIQHGTDQTFLEIASGSGQHVAHFAPHFPHITFYPSECDPQFLESIAAHANGISNIKDPLRIDISKHFTTWGNGVFKESSIDYIYNSNMMHISPYECAVGLFENAGKLLKKNGFLFTYGPYAVDGKISAESNVTLDKLLRMHGERWGLRDIRDLEKLATRNNIKMIHIFDMAANNNTIIWKKY